MRAPNLKTAMDQSQTSQRGQAYRYLDLITALFVTVLVLSNILSSAKVVDWGVSIFGIPLAFDAGTILFPVSYIFGDVLTEVYGYKRSRRVIWTGFGCLALSSAILFVVKVLPGEENWQRYAGQAAYDAILGGMTSGGIVIASLLGYWGGEFSNSFTLAKMKIWTKGSLLWSRTIGSTLVGEGVDTLVFVCVATLFGVFPPTIMGSLILTNYIFKVGVEVVFTPITYAAVNFLKEVEREDYFDLYTDFNPFRLEFR